MMDGLYHMQIELLGGGKTTNAGVMVMRHGQILGGDAFFYYTGSYAATDGDWSGELTTRQHTRSGEYRPAFGALDVVVVLKGKKNGTVLEGTASVQAPDAAASYKVSLQKIDDA